MNCCKNASCRKARGVAYWKYGLCNSCEAAAIRLGMLAMPIYPLSDKEARLSLSFEALGEMKDVLTKMRVGEREKEELVKVTLKMDDGSEKDSSGGTPLRLAALRSHLGVVEFLKSKGQSKSKSEREKGEIK